MDSAAEEEEEGSAAAADGDAKKFTRVTTCSGDRSSICPASSSGASPKTSAVIAVLARGFRVAEVPATIHKRQVGESKKGHNAIYGLHYAGVVTGTCIGLMLSLLLGYKLGWFPVSGYETGIGGILRTCTLPALTVGLGLLVIVVRNLRANLVTVLHSEYIEAARARGYSELRVVSKHAMRNSIVGLITILASLFGFIVGLLVLVESVFRIPGAGTLLVQAVSKRDYQLVQTLVFLSGAFVVIVGLLADFAYAWLDPRIRLAGRS